MSSNREIFTSEIYVNNEQAQDATAKLTEKLEKQTQAYEKLRNELGDFDKKTLKAKHAMEDTQRSIDSVKVGTEKYRKAIEDLSGKSMSQLVKMQKQLKKELDLTNPDTEEWKRLSKEYQDVTARMKSLGDAQRGVTTGMGKLTGGMGGLMGKLGNLGSIITAMPTLLKGVRIGVKAITAVVRETVSASQTMGDKWNNAMDAMKSTTNAFFAALSTGDWSAFNDGLAEALKKARELAELKDLLGSFQIAGEYVQKEDLAKMTAARTKATDTEAGVEERKKALEEMKAAVESYNEFVTAQGQATYDMLIKSFDQMKGIQFSSEPEFKSFFDRLFRYSTTGRDEELNHALASYEYTWKELSKRYKDSYGQINQVMTEREAKEEALRRVEERYGEETRKLIQAVEINDKGHQALVQTYGLYADAVRTVEQQTRTYNRTRDQVNKQLYSEELKHLQKANNVTLNIWKAQYAKGIIDKATFEAKKLKLEQQAQQQSIELASKYGQDTTALYTKQWDDIIKQMEDEAKKAADAADKAYQAAMKRVEKQESEQKLVWKRQYAAGLIDKQLYEARIAEVEEDFMKQKMATAEKYGKDTDQFMSQLLDRQIARMQKAKELLKEEMDEMMKVYASEHPDQNVSDEEDERNRDNQRRQGYKEKLGTIPGETDEEFDARIEQYEAFQEKLLAKAADIRAAITEDSARTEYENEVAWAQKLAEQKKITAEEAERYILQAKLKYAQQAAQQVSAIMSEASNFVTQLKEFETQKLEAEYQAQLAAAGDNAEKREEIENEYEQKQLDLKKKYADTEMAINIAKTIASGAVAAIKAYAEGGPYLGIALAALIAATTAAEVATIVAQRNAIKNASVGGSSSGGSSPTVVTPTGYSEGGFTTRAANDNKPAGIVHANEWVAPAYMVRRNPVLFANLEQYRLAGGRGRSGSASRGFAEGGFTGSGAVVSDAISRKMLSAIERLETTTAANAAAINRLQEEGVPSYMVYDQYQSFDTQRKRFKNATKR